MVATRFLIVSDTHNFQFEPAIEYGAKFRYPPPKCDVLLHAGDLTMSGTLGEFKACIQMLGSIEAELKLVIAGNHDRGLDKEYCETHTWSYPPVSKEHEKSVELWKGPVAKEAGITYLEEGLHTFTLKNGAKFTIYASPYQPEFCDWAFPYSRNEDRFNPAEKVEVGFKCITENPIPDFPSVDIMMTHGPPNGILDETSSGTDAGCRSLMRAVSRARPQLYCFGHIHEAYGAKLVNWKEDKEFLGPSAVQNQEDIANPYPQVSNQRPVEFGRETLMANASIMNLPYCPVNAPWVVDLDLQKA